MANEWNQLRCYWAPPPAPPNASLCPNGQRDVSDPGCGYGGSNLPAWDTPIWDQLFQTVHKEDPSGHLLSIHNNAFLYNYSRPWMTHFSLKHTHNKPRDLWHIYGLKPFMYDEVKYEGRLGSNWCGPMNFSAACFSLVVRAYYWCRTLLHAQGVALRTADGAALLVDNSRRCVRDARRDAVSVSVLV